MQQTIETSNIRRIEEKETETEKNKRKKYLSIKTRRHRDTL